MDNLNSYGDYDSLTSTIEELDTNWSNITTVTGLEHTVSKLLSELGCKEVIFLNRNTPLIGKVFPTLIQCFFVEKKLPPVEAELDAADKNALMINIDAKYSARTSSTSPIHSFLEKDVMSANALTSYLTASDHYCIARHFSSTNRTSYTIFTSHNGELTRPGLVSSSLYVILGLMHRKLEEIHLHKKQRQVNVTPREKEVLESLIKGQTNGEIASDLDISPHTINSYIKALGLKLGTKNRTATAMNAIALGLVNI